MKMGLWTFYVVFPLCFCTNLQIVFTKKTLVTKMLKDWIEDRGSKPGEKVTEEWSHSFARKRLYTDVKPGGASWLVTPILNLPNTSYLDMDASCSNHPCQLEIYGTNHSTAKVLENYEFVQNVTFQKRSNNTATIKKSYPHLYILARVSNTTSGRAFYIYSIEIRFYFCKKKTIYNTRLSQVYSSTTNISKSIRCPDNAVSNDNKSTNITRANCTPKGNWIYGKCVCDKGFYTAKNPTQECSRCATDYYKNIIGNEECQKCPEGKTNNSMHTGCECKTDHYPGNDGDESCYAETPTTPTTKASEPSKQNKSEEKKDNNIFIYVGAAVGFVVIIVFIILIFITRYRRGKLKKDGKDNHGFENIPFSQRIYVDPSIYDDPEAALRDFANEISEKSLKLERVIGGGEFGDVYKGILKTEDRGNIEVAVKTLKYDADARSRKDFFLEGSAMGQFDDLNVIHLEGVITKSTPHKIVIEYMSNGSLDNFLKKNDGQFTDLQLVGMARGVASGMKYLAAMNFVHRDLAARNILVNEGMLCKVADFGLSRELENADESSLGEYCASGGKIPVRWTAPEAIKYRKFSTASDVWSYGILLWEIMSFGARPYWDWDNFKLLERVDEGYRLPAPKNCPKAVHELMLLCWETSRENRPEFAAIVGMLDDWIRSPETIRYERLSRRPVSGASVNDPVMLIKEWLHDIKMSSYIPHFTQAGFTQLSDLAGLQDNDLQNIGISLIGHRNKMLRTIRSLPITREIKKTTLNRSGSLKV